MSVQDNKFIDRMLLSKVPQVHFVTKIILHIRLISTKSASTLLQHQCCAGQAFDLRQKTANAFLTDETSIPHLLITTKLCWCNY